jgi:hypothetical protein
MTMRGLGALLVAIGLTVGACGNHAHTDDSEQPEPETVAMLSATAAGGQTSTMPTMLGDEGAVDTYVSQFQRGGLAAQITRAFQQADRSAGGTLAAAVVAVGCDVPPGVEISSTASGYRVTAHPVASPLRECFAAVTTVALVRLPASQ